MSKNPSDNASDNASKESGKIRFEKQPMNNPKKSLLVFCILASLTFSTLIFFSYSYPPHSDLPKINIAFEEEYITDDFYIDCIFELNHESIPGRIKVRGGVSAGRPKKGYRLELSRRISLCGMRKDDDWQLFPMAKDLTRMKYKLCFDLWRSLRDMGHKEAILPKSKFINLYTNGEYKGLFLLAEKNDRRLLNLDLGQNNIESSLIFQAKGYTSFRIYTGWKQDWPNEEEGMIIMEPIMKKLIKFVVHYNNSEFFDEEEGIFSKFNKLNLIDFYLFNYFIQHRDFWDFNYFIARDTHPSKFFLIPWDFEHSFGQFHDHDIIDPDDNEESDVKKKNKIYDRLLENTEFKQDCKERWIKLREDLWTEDFILDMISDMYKEIKDSLEVDMKMWKPHINADDYVEYMIDWIPDRLEYCDSYFGEF